MFNPVFYKIKNYYEIHSYDGYSNIFWLVNAFLAKSLNFICNIQQVEV